MWLKVSAFLLVFTLRFILLESIICGVVEVHITELELNDLKFGF